jgi:hypothetical protein
MLQTTTVLEHTRTQKEMQVRYFKFLLIQSISLNKQNISISSMSNTGARTTTGALHFIYVHKVERLDEGRSYLRAQANPRGGGMQTNP